MQTRHPLNDTLIQQLLGPTVGAALDYGQYEGTIRTYMERDHGRFHILSRDKTFTSLLRTTLDSISPTSAPLCISRKEEELLAALRVEGGLGRFVVLFVDEDVARASLGAALGRIRAACPSVKIVVLAAEASVAEIALLHEQGADNFIVKPVSPNSLLLKTAFTIRPHGEVGRHLDAARGMLTGGKWKLAMKMADKVLGMRSDCPAAFMLKGDALIAGQRSDEAREAYEAACKTSSLFMAPLKRLARLDGNRGDARGQLRHLRRLDEISPLNVERKVTMGKVLLDLGREEDAEDAFGTALELAQHAAAELVATTSLAVADAYMSKAPATAEDYYRRAMATTGFDASGNIAVFNRLGTALRKQGKWREALREYDHALELAPGDENLHYNKALAHADGSQFQEAYLCVNTALAMDPDFGSRSHIIALNCAVIARDAGRPEKAEALCRTALHLNPGYAKALRLLEQLGATEPVAD